jgi:hypothetical protein
MRDSKAAAAVIARIKYDWIVLLYGLFCVLFQFVHPRDSEGFLLLVGVFVLIEGFCVSAFRKLQKGDEGYHVLSKQFLTQQSSAGSIYFCIAMEFALLIGISPVFFADVLKGN